MALSNHERIDRGLTLLRTGLQPFVERELKAFYGNIWWSDGIEGEQVFLPHEYDKIAQLVKPVGGGGTRVSCVAEYIREKQYKPKACIYLTDGYIESNYEVVDGCQVLFGVVDNDHFVPSKGKAVRIYSEVSV